jgi:hypothetical protein
MESRFGHNFSQVRIHSDQAAAKSARAVDAVAYTIGRDIVFGEGRYEPATRQGQKLIAHELTHVVQQNRTASEGSSARVVQRQEIGNAPPMEDPRDPAISSAPKGKSWTGASAKCGVNFCRPWPTQRMAEDERKTLWPILMLGIGAKVSTRVLPVWTQWAFGGGGVQNFNKEFGGDFLASPTTAKTTTFLVDELKKALAASPPAIPAAGFVTLDIPPLIPGPVKAIDTPGDPHEMNFNVIGDIPGNLAGGIGKDQAANPVGATPSPQDDERIAKGSVTVVNTGGGTLMAVPNLSYTVKDTVDLCPGDCGAAKERIATIPMSRWEATGISGDVPFTVDFPAITFPFMIAGPSAPAPAPAPVPAPAPTKP